ncbi:MAG: DNA cytosine methyltransferase [Proteobacteria bacterium]|nr:DNA cytosine methyltransferase [Pseudomonadota bacterium]
MGLQKAGFDVRAAVEIDSTSAATYRLNHTQGNVIDKDIREVHGTELARAVGESSVAVIAGCAPCQGFCSLARRGAKDDPRDRLLAEMARLIEEFRPDAVVMENVPGLQTQGRLVFKKFLTSLNDLGYYSNWGVIQMADYGVPQSRRRLVLTAGRGIVIPLPKTTHSVRPNAKNNLSPWITLQEAIGAMQKPVTLSQAKRAGGPREFNWHVVRDLQPQTKARLDAAIPGKTWLNVKEKIRPKCHQGGYRGFTNSYGRMSWDQVSATITAGCTTACKGRFGHPDPKRTTISVREAAILQTFPEDYQFASDKIDAVCQMIGNAVPPRFAQALGMQVKASLEAHYGALASKN